MKPTTCPKGHYCLGGTSSALPCPEGTLNPCEGALSPRACQPCPAGRYCPGEGNGQSEGGASEGSCGPCPAGSFCPGLSLSSPISSCVAGSECSWNLRTSSSMAFLCPQGHFCQLGSAWPAPCHQGEYQPSLGSDTCLSLGVQGEHLDQDDGKQVSSPVPVWVNNLGAAS
ncbi:signal peptide, CUB and EGF-like domain-containing protein 3 [Ailuropoda melanoleuca]|uniref:signal peptide, CUB and EGF-like domain-containing protein 3 n=1 Tax=Ailuropoda melanoleuca TaxID=9646 RepID=UPI0014948487|nr:signal peptide, CUB and EGF-like domain-containing protein 3 [Ailuropoda melanoleuca]